MKRFSSGLLALCLLPMVLHADMDIGIDGMYISGRAGLGLPRDRGDVSYKAGFDLGAIIGNKSSNVRYEGELTWQRNRASASNGDKVHTSVMGIMANLHYDFEDVEVLTMLPSLGFGLGGTRVNSSGSSDDTVFAYQLMLNFHYPLANDWSGFIGYKFFRTDKVKHLGDGTWQNHLLSVGLTYHLG